MLKLTIGHKVVLLVLLCSFLSILLLSGISFSGMSQTWRNVTSTAARLGDSAAEDSRTALIEQAQNQLVALAWEKARYTESKLQVIRDNVTILAAQMSSLVSNPGAYAPRVPSEPNRTDAGIITPQLLFSASVADKNAPALREEIGAAGNIQDFLVRMNSVSDVIASSYVASQNGFVIMADKIADHKFIDGDSTTPAPYEAFQRPWYVEAHTEQKLIFTNVINDFHGGGPCIICASPYTDNGEFAGVVGIGSYLTEIIDIVLSTQIGRTGFGFIVNQKGEIVVSPKAEGELAADPDRPVDLRKGGNLPLGQTVSKMVGGDSGIAQVTLDGRECYLAYAPLTLTGWSFATVIEADEVVAPAVQSRADITLIASNAVAAMEETRSSLFANMIIAAAVLLVLVGGAGGVLSARLVHPIKTLIAGVHKISAGDLNTHIDIHTNDEIESLSSAFNLMTDNLGAYIEELTTVTAEKERIAAELSVAKRIQSSMLPRIFPAFPERPEFDLFATMHPAKEVGGDFYDFFLVDSDHLALVMADVSGKGVPAALFMVVTKTLLKNLAQTGLPPRKVLEELNDQLCENNEADMFVTVWFGILELSTGKLTCANAGHERPVLRRANGGFELLHDKHGFVLGGIAGSKYTEYELLLAKGDQLYVYTDGVAEATDAHGELYGVNRLLAALNRDRNASPPELLSAIKTDIETFVGETPQFDDITMLTLVLR